MNERKFFMFHSETSRRMYARDRCDNYCVSKEKEHETCKIPERIDCGPGMPSFTINFARTDSLSLFANGYHSHT